MLPTPTSRKREQNDVLRRPKQQSPCAPVGLLLPQQMLYDVTYEWLTTQGWSFVPFGNYGVGGAEVEFAPLEANAADYDLAWAIHMGYE